MNFGFLAVLSIGAVLLAIIAGNKTVEKQAKRIEKTKILASAPHCTGRLNGTFYTETTFMVYYSDGTHKTVTVKNDTMEYKSYMSKLEG